MEEKWKKKSRLLLLLIIAMTFTVAFVGQDVANAETVGAVTNDETPDFSDYTPISTKEDLNNIRNDLDGKYYLTCDIVFNEEDFEEGGAFYNDGKGWIPIGETYENPFSGIFDGNGNTVKGLKIDLSNVGQVFVGLFGCSTGKIENLGIIDGNISGKSIGYTEEKPYSDCYCGGVVGHNRGVIRNCYNMADIKVENSLTGIYCGGIAGINMGDEMKGCYNTGNVTVKKGEQSLANRVSMGGICGEINSCILENCYNSGKLFLMGEVSGNIGGIYGYGVGGDAKVGNCYNRGDITVENEELHIGGIAGGGTMQIQYCYNVGSFIAESDYIGGIVGHNFRPLEGCYYLDNTKSGVGNYQEDGNYKNEFCYEHETVRLSDKDFQDMKKLPKLDFDNTWKYNKNGNYLYPVLIYFNNICNHNYSEWKTTKEPTCSAVGEKERVCVDCGNKETEMIPINSDVHRFTKYVYNNDAKVGVDGTETAVCDFGCGTTDTRTKVGSALSNGGSSGGIGGGGYLPPTLEPQKPTITETDSADVTLGADGTTATIKVKDDYELVDVLVNGVSKGAVTELSGLKTGDVIEVKTKLKETPPTVDQIRTQLEMVSGDNFKAQSKQVKMKSGRKAIKITWKNTSGVKFDGVQIFRSTKKNSGYGKKPFYTSKTGRFYNTSIKKGKRYYYKVRGYIEYDGVKYYSGWSTKTWRTVK